MKTYTEEEYKALCSQHNAQRFLCKKAEAENVGLRAQVRALIDELRLTIQENRKSSVTEAKE